VSEADTLARLERLDLEGLRGEWARLFGPAPKLRSVELLRRLIAWRLEAEADPTLVEQLRARLGHPGVKTASSSSILRSGDVVFREWQGIRHEVSVREDGKVEHDGRVYDSLSAVARAITGVRWNGPRFFGLRTEP
jgi:hypothetical protein